MEEERLQPALSAKQEEPESGEAEQLEAVVAAAADAEAAAGEAGVADEAVVQIQERVHEDDAEIRQHRRHLGRSQHGLRGQADPQGPGRSHGVLEDRVREPPRARDLQVHGGFARTRLQQVVAQNLLAFSLLCKYFVMFSTIILMELIN